MSDNNTSDNNTLDSSSSFSLAIPSNNNSNSILINLDVYNTISNTYERQSINLYDVIGKGRWRLRNDETTRFYLPRDVFTQNTPEFRKRYVLKYIASAFQSHNITITTKGWEKTDQRILFKCPMGRAYNPVQSQKQVQKSAARKVTANKTHLLTPKEQEALKKLTVEDIQQINSLYQKEFQERNTKSRLPATSEGCCRFSLPLYWQASSTNDGNSGFWYFCQNKTGCLTHRGQCQKQQDEKKQQELVRIHNVLVANCQKTFSNPTPLSVQEYQQLEASIQQVGTMKRIEPIMNELAKIADTSPLLSHMIQQHLQSYLNQMETLPAVLEEAKQQNNSSHHHLADSHPKRKKATQDDDAGIFQDL